MARQRIELAAEEAEELSRRARATTVPVRDRPATAFDFRQPLARARAGGEVLGRSAYLQLFLDQCDADAEAGLIATLRSSGTSNVATMKASMIARNASA